MVICLEMPITFSVLMKRMTGALDRYARVLRGMMLAENLRKLLCYARLIEMIKKQRQRSERND